MINQSKIDYFRFKRWALFGISILAFTAFLDATIVDTALPFIQVALKANILQLQWVANIFTIILSMTMIAVGKLADLCGRKKIFYIGIVIFGVTAFGAGLSGSIEVLILFRGLQALGASTVFVASAALLSDVFPKNERIKAISIYGGVTGFGLMIGPFLGGVLVGALNWRWVFWINIPLIVMGLIACSFSLKEYSVEKNIIKFDVKGLILLVIGLGFLMYGIVAGAQYNWRSIVTWCFLIIGVVALVLLIIIDKINKNPLLDFRIFNQSIISLASVSCALAGVASTVFMFFDPLYLRILREFSPFVIGLLIAVIPAAQTLISLIFDNSVKYFGVANLLLFSVLAAVLAIGLHRLMYLDTPILLLIFPFFLLGINWGLSNSAMMAAVNQVITSHNIGGAIGTIATIWNIVGSIILAISAAIFHSIELNQSFLPAFHRIVDFNIIFAFMALIIAIWIRLRLKHQSGAF